MAAPGERGHSPGSYRREAAGRPWKFVAQNLPLENGIFSTDSRNCY